MLSVSYSLHCKCNTYAFIHAGLLLFLYTARILQIIFIIILGSLFVSPPLFFTIYPFFFSSLNFLLPFYRNQLNFSHIHVSLLFNIIFTHPCLKVKSQYLIYWSLYKVVILILLPLMTAGIRVASFSWRSSNSWRR